VPDEMPVTTPEVFIVAIPGSELLHVPPPVVPDQVDVAPIQIGFVPVIV